MSEYPTAGRPELPKEERRSVYIMLRLTPAEKEAVKKAAKMVSRTPTDFARLVVLEACKDFLQK